MPNKENLPKEILGLWPTGSSGDLTWWAPKGLYYPCSGVWDDTSNSFRNAHDSEVFECCLDLCTPASQYCNKKCNEELQRIYNPSTHAALPPAQAHKRCLKTCDIFTDLCRSQCRISAPGFNVDNKYFSCADSVGCPRGLGQVPDAKCVKKHKDTIMKCCRKECVPGYTVDCQHECDTLQSVVLDPAALGLPPNTSTQNIAQEIQDSKRTSNSKSEMLSKYSIHPDHTARDIAIAILVALVILGGGYWWYRYKS